MSEPRTKAVLRRVLAAALALLVVLVAAGVPGTRLAFLPVQLEAAPLPPDTKDRDASLVVRVHAQADGAPVAGARVRAFAIMGGRAYDAGTGETDPGGVARLASLPRGEHWIVIEAARFARGSSHLVLTPGERELEVALGPEHMLDVSVNDERGAPVIGAEVEVVGKDPLPTGGRVDENGHAMIARLGEGPWTVRVRAPGYDEATAHGLKDGDRAIITLKKLGGLIVKVVGWDDSFVPGAHVLIAGATLWPPRSAETDKTGSVRIAGLPGGSYALRAVYGTDCSPIEFGVMLARGEEKTVVLHLAPGHMVAMRVTDGDTPDAQPIEGARVSLVEGGLSPFPIEGHTDKAGRAKLGPISQGAAYLAARAEGYVPRGSVPVPSPQPEEVVVPLARAGALLGRVTDARGFPIDGATIEIIGTDFYGAPIAEDPRRASFREAHFEAVAAGPTELVPAGELGVVPGPVPPIPHAIGGAGWETSSAPLRPATGATTAEPWVSKNDGTFEARPAPPGRIRAIVRHPEFVEAMSQVVTLTTGGEATVDVVLHKGGTLEGRVLDENDRPVSGARVTLAATRGTLERTTSTASDGTFAFASVPDSVMLSVIESDDAAQVATREVVEVPEGERKEITLHLPAKRDPLPARVKDDRDFPIKDAQITVHSLDPKVPLRATVFTDEGGEATIANARGLPLRVQISAPGFAPAQLSTGTDAAKLEASLSRAERATGEVVEERTRDPIPNAEVVLYTDLGARHTKTKEDGTFAVEGLAPGTAKLRVRAKGFAPQSKSITIPASGGDRPFEIPRVELAYEGSVEGRVVDQRGDPVQGARVAKDRVPTYLAVGGTPPDVAVTDVDGRFTLHELPAGDDLTLEAYAPDVGRTRVTGVSVVPGRTTIDLRIVLEPGDTEKSARPLDATGGVAVTLGETVAPKEVVVVSVAEGSEAERAGLAPNDVLLAVDDDAVHTMEEARAKLSGPVGEDCVVKVRRGDRTELVRVARERVRR